MSSFDPEPDKPHGVCNDCGAEMATEQDASDHMRETFEAAKAAGKVQRSHSVRVTNPGRQTRIRRRLGTIIDDAISNAMEEIDRLLEQEADLRGRGR